MSSGNVYARLFKQWTAITKAVMEVNWDPEKVADYLQSLINNPPRVKKFVLLVDLGITTVHADYEHGNQLKKFFEQNSDKLFNINYEITDKNFPNPTRVLRPGDRLRIRAFKQVVGGSTTTEERVDFLRKEKAVFIGAQGASLVFERKCNQLPKCKQYTSFDEKDRLWIDDAGVHRLPNIDCCSNGDFMLRLGDFEQSNRSDVALLCFTEVEEDGQKNYHDLTPLEKSLVE